MVRRGGERGISSVGFFSPASAMPKVRAGEARESPSADVPASDGTVPSLALWCSSHTFESSEPFWPLRRGGQRLLPASRGAEHLSSKSLFKVMWIFFVSPEMHSNIFP